MKLTGEIRHYLSEVLQRKTGFPVLVYENGKIVSKITNEEIAFIYSIEPNKIAVDFVIHTKTNPAKVLTISINNKSLKDKGMWF
jgi:hypothetical protein